MSEPNPNWMGDWLVPVTETLHFSNEILQSHDRTEQRISLRKGYSRHTYTTRERVKKTDWPTFAAILHKSAKSTWQIPIWTESEVYTSTLSAGASTIAIDTRYANYVVGDYAAIYQPGLYEVAVVQAVTDNLLTLTAGISNTYIDQCFVMPCKHAYLQDQLTAENNPNNIVINSLWLLQDAELITGFTPVLEYDGMTVLTDPTLIRDAEGNEIHWNDIFFHDYNTGLFQVNNNSDFNEVSQTVDWRFEDKADAWWFRQFLHDIYGTQKPFLLPTFQDDMVLAAQAGASDTELSITLDDLSENYVTPGPRTYVGVYIANTLVVRQVLSFAVDSGSGNEALVLDATFGSILPVGTKLCWVDVCRLSGDEISFTWEDRYTMFCQTAVTRVGG